MSLVASIRRQPDGDSRRVNMSFRAKRGAASNIEAEVDDVAVLDWVVAAF